jgi:hypothetical protein
MCHSTSPCYRMTTPPMNALSGYTKLCLFDCSFVLACLVLACISIAFAFLLLVHA